MPKYYCDYCDTFLTHDSPSVRKTHCNGRKHKENVRLYYQTWMEEQAQKLIDSTTAAYKAGKLTTPLPPFMLGMMGLPPMPPGMMPPPPGALGLPPPLGGMHPPPMGGMIQHMPPGFPNSMPPMHMMPPGMGLRPMMGQNDENSNVLPPGLNMMQNSM
ncbi:U1 small nuclear ribonucleoprotein C-like [Gordionus sp. m RMFG-2023]|uniref:U1 small nuclear ribonucleoprotein C-like n=1 Tax=Gordionus sp. m RMFG-2023 TaxID=3053472 RepID=UPI0031FD029B